MALGIGVASLVQPELIVGSVALVGKMAADATKETIDEIVVESGNSIVKGIAKEVTDETAELAAQDGMVCPIGTVKFELRQLILKPI